MTVGSAWPDIYICIYIPKDRYGSRRIPEVPPAWGAQNMHLFGATLVFLGFGGNSYTPGRSGPGSAVTEVTLAESPVTDNIPS